MELLGQVALVTGGSRGIGRATALAFAREGADIGFCHLDDSAEASETALKIQAMGRKVVHANVNVADIVASGGFAGHVAAELGAIDILFNNAGSNIKKPFEDITEMDFDAIVDVHLKGMFFMAQSVYPSMKLRRRGCIINIASQLGIKGGSNLSPYCAAKAGIAGFTRALAWEAAPFGIRVNAIAPGPIETDLVRGNSAAWRAEFVARLPLGRFGTPEEVAATAVLLAGPHGGFYVGATLSPNGGDVMH